MVDPVQVIQATLAPVFLISGAAIFLNFVQARLFRVVDRLRSINTTLRKGTHDEDDRPRLVKQQRRNLRRALILRNAIFFGVLVIAFTVLTTILILLIANYAATDVGPWILIAFTAALVSFAIALTLSVTDAFLSVGSMREAAQEYAETAGD